MTAWALQRQREHIAVVFGGAAHGAELTGVGSRWTSPLEAHCVGCSVMSHLGYGRISGSDGSWIALPGPVRTVAVGCGARSPGADMDAESSPVVTAASWVLERGMSSTGARPRFVERPDGGGGLRQQDTSGRLLLDR